MVDIKKYQFFQKLQSLPFIEAIWLYGSRARGDQKERSDFDIAIICPHATTADWHTVLEVVEEADTLLKIDCVRYDDLKGDDKLKKNIDRFKVILFQRSI